MVKSLTLKYNKQAALLHIQGMPDDFLPSFGEKFMYNLYRYFLELDGIYAYGYFVKETLVGIIIGTENTSKAMITVYRRGFWTLGFYVLLKLIDSPLETIPKLYQTLTYGSNSHNLSSSELIVLSVDKNQHRKGIATKLLAKLRKELKKKGINKFKVGTKTTNIEANSFYKKSGGKLAKTVTIYGNLWNLYIYQS